MERRRSPFLLVALIVLGLVASLPARAQNARGAAYRVVINHEEQYAIWPADREPPEGWDATGEPCTRARCRAYILEVWTDMRPLSLRKTMEAKKMPRDRARYQVVINHEEQYSLRLAGQEVAKPWRATGTVCTWNDCRAHIEEVWTDMRPLSVREER